jgi:hypothetical protein
MLILGGIILFLVLLVVGFSVFVTIATWIVMKSIVLLFGLLGGIVGLGIWAIFPNAIDGRLAFWVGAILGVIAGIYWLAHLGDENK